MRTLLLTEHTDLTLRGKKTKKTSRGQRENTIPAEKERGEREKWGGRTPESTHTGQRKRQREPQPTLRFFGTEFPQGLSCVYLGWQKSSCSWQRKKNLCERERESKQEPSREDKIPKKKDSKIRSPNSKTLYCEFPCTELCP
jgi:hypothetical protein